MDARLRQSMFRYYDERATKYEDAYLLGTGTASLRDPHVFQREAKLLGGMVQRVAYGELIDLACGTAFWLPHYAPRCRSITLFDQSERMLRRVQEEDGGAWHGQALHHRSRRVLRVQTSRAARMIRCWSVSS